jgi:hypothetical protein
MHLEKLGISLAAWAMDKKMAVFGLSCQPSVL